MKKTAKILTNAFALTLCFFACIFAQGRGAPPVPDISDFAFSRDGQAVVQLFTVPDHDLARRIVQRFREGRIPAYYARVENPAEMREPGVYYRIRIRGFDSRETASEFGHRFLTPLGYTFMTCLMENDTVASARAALPNEPPPAVIVRTDPPAQEKPAAPIVEQEAPVQEPSAIFAVQETHYYDDYDRFLPIEYVIPPNRFLFSARPEFIVGRPTMAVGHAFEFGAVDRGNFYFTAQIMGGYAYFGGIVNLGVCFNQHGIVKNVLGVGGGYTNRLHFIDVIRESGGETEKIDSYTAQNLSFGGPFWKFMIGRRKYNFDITKRVSFGIQNSPIDYYDEKREYRYSNRKFNVMFTVGAGYTFIGRSSRKEAATTVASGGEIFYPVADTQERAHPNGQEVNL